MLKNPQFKRIKGREAPKRKSGLLKSDPSGAFHNSRPKLKYALDFIVEMGLGPTFQEYLDKKGSKSSLRLYYRK